MIMLVSCLSYQLPDALARASAQPYTAMVIVPTGIGAAIGGYAGDALPVARAFTAVADRVITHPNVMNGAQLYWPDPKLLYVEGYALDQFAVGRRCGKRPPKRRRPTRPSSTPRQRQIKLRAASSLDQPRPTGRHVLAGRPYRPP